MSAVRRVRIDVNRREIEATVETRLLLVHFLRSIAGTTSVKIGCDTTSCGACTVMLDRRPVKACTWFAVQADGSSVRTVESLAGADGSLHPLQQAFWDEHGLQCGFCTSGIMMAALNLVTSGEVPTGDEVSEAISGNICRCTGYVNIVKAVQSAARSMNPEPGDPEATR